jgi:hypothetical protein
LENTGAKAERVWTRSKSLDSFLPMMLAAND